MARMVLLNLAVRNVSTSAEDAENDAIVVDLTPFLREEEGAKVKRMTSPGLDSKDVGLVTWAGQSFENGTASGEEVEERLENGTVTVMGSEGVLVFF